MGEIETIKTKGSWQVRELDDGKVRIIWFDGETIETSSVLSYLDLVPEEAKKLISSVAKALGIKDSLPFG